MTLILFFLVIFAVPALSAHVFGTIDDAPPALPGERPTLFERYLGGRHRRAIRRALWSPYDLVRIEHECLDKDLLDAAIAAASAKPKPRSGRVEEWVDPALAAALAARTWTGLSAPGLAESVRFLYAPRGVRSVIRAEIDRLTMVDEGVARQRSALGRARSALGRANGL